MTETGIRTAIMLAPLFLILTGLAFTVMIDPYIRRSQRRVMLVIVALTGCVVFQNVSEYLLTAQSVNPAPRVWLSIFGYSVRPVIIMLFLLIIGIGCRTWPFWTLLGANALIHLTALFSDVCFSYPENVFRRGPLGYTSHIVSGILLAFLLFRTIREYSRVRRLEMWIPIANALLIVAAVVLDSGVFTHLDTPVSFLTVSMVCSTLFFYIWLHFQFVREHERDLMAAGRIRIMMTQIQPHFLFNALNTIRALYAKDPPLADRTLEDFSTYLRQNLESLSRSDRIPIAKELEHTRLYAEIEVLRFPNVRVEYRIEDEAFEVPALTVQPLVENAIRHGVRGRADGLVTVSTSREEGVHRITVEDNGVGFDPKKPASPDDRHIGLENVKSRVEHMCGGTMTVKSEIGKGTAVTLLIPDASENGRKERET